MGLVREAIQLIKDIAGSMEGVIWIVFMVLGNYAVDFYGWQYMLSINLVGIGVPIFILQRRARNSEKMQYKGEIQVTTEQQVKSIDEYVVLVTEQQEKQKRKRNIFQKIWNWF